MKTCIRGQDRLCALAIGRLRGLCGVLREMADFGGAEERRLLDPSRADTIRPNLIDCLFDMIGESQGKGKK